tara:strand:+ start:69 stop:710 length:642 start_codon:yes stop_codon:yes gene_type:complete
MKSHELWEKKKILLDELEDLQSQAREPNHSHEFYDEVAEEISLCEKNLETINSIFKDKEWHRDLHRLICQFKSFTNKEKNLARIIYVLTSRLSLAERKRLVHRWDLQNKVQESQEKEFQKELKKEIRLQRRKLKRIKTARNMYPEFESLSDEEVLIQKKIKDDEKNRLINKTKNKTKLKIITKEPTSESIEYWRKKWGITKASLEEDEEVSSS